MTGPWMRFVAPLLCAGMLTQAARGQTPPNPTRGATGPEPTQGSLQNAAQATLGATAKGSGAPFNKDWPAARCIQDEKARGGGALFGSPMKNGRVDIRLIVPVEIVAVELVPLDYHGTLLPKAVDLYVDGKRLTHAELPESPRKAVRVPLSARGQDVGVVVTDTYPLRDLGNGKKGPNYGGWERIRVLTTTDVAGLLAHVDDYTAAAQPVNIAPTSGSLVGEPAQVSGAPRVAKGHPCTIWDAEDVAHYQAMLKTSAVLREQYDGLRRALDDRLKQPAGIPVPQKDEEGKWKHLSDRQFGATHNQLALDIANLGAVYALSGEAKYGEFAKRLLLDYADAYANYAPGNRPGFTHDVGKCFDQRLGDATWLIQVARGYDLVYNLPSLTEAERRHIEEDLIKAAARFIAANGSMLRGPTNWSAIATAAILMAGAATDDETLVNLARWGAGGTPESPKGGIWLHFSERSIDADGMWAEGAMGYQFMALQALVTDAEVLWHRGEDMYRYRDSALRRLFDSPLEFSYPDLTTPAIHDSGHGSIVGREAYLYEFAYRRYSNPKYLSVLKQAGMHLAAAFQQFPVSVLYDLDPAAAAEPAQWRSVNFYGVGYGVLRLTSQRGTSSLLLDYGPNRSHGHPDKLNIDLWTLGDRLLPDAGSVWYEQPLYRRWYHTTMAHNTLCIDELEQQPCDGEQLVYGPAETLALQRARADRAYSGVTMDRAVFLTPEYVADLFGAFARLPRQMDLCWHVRGDMQSELPLKPVQRPAPAENGYNELGNPRAAITSDAYALAFTRGETPFALRAAGGPETEVLVGEGQLGRERPVAILQRRRTASTVYGNAVDTSGVTGGYVRSVATEGGLESGWALLRVQTTRGEDLCFTAYRPGRHEAGGLATDALQAMVLRDGGELCALYLGGGTTLQVGAAAIRRSAPGLAYVERAETGSYIVGNPSPEAADVTVALPGLAGLKCHDLDWQGGRRGTHAAETGASAVTVELAPGARVEFARAGAPSVWDHRRAILIKRQQEQDAAQARARDEALARSQARSSAAQARPVPAGTVVVVQAEDFTAQEGGEVRISSTKRAIIGKAFSSWDPIGHWLEYGVDVPAEGFYHLALLYCAEEPGERELQVNGEMQEPFAPLRLPPTGGWSNGSDDWRLFVAPDPVAARPLLLRLNAGRNVIRLTNTDGRGVNLDYLAVFGPDVQVTREMLAERLTAK